MPKNGRPEIDDDDILREMAKVVLDDPQLPMAEVVRRVIPSYPTQHSLEAAIRRLRDKFNSRREYLLANAIPEVWLPCEQIAHMGIRIVSPEMQNVAAQIARVGEGMRRAFDTPDMRLLRKNLEATRWSFETPEMMHLVENVQKAMIAFGRLNLPRLA